MKSERPRRRRIGQHVGQKAAETAQLGRIEDENQAADEQHAEAEG